ncbi:MAG: DUF885 family protein [Acidimicrobiales bacterium]
MADIFEVSSLALDRLHELDPVLSTFEGDYANASEWTDFSPAGTAAVRDFWQALRTDALDATADGRFGTLAQRVLVDECDVRLADIDRRWSVRDLNNIVSPWQYIREVFSQAPTSSVADWEAICTPSRPWTRRWAAISIVERGHRDWRGARPPPGRDRHRTGTAGCGP